MRFAPVVLATLTACATVSPAPPREATPARALQSMTAGALPHLRLREMALGATLDSIVRGSTPTGSGQVLCSTGTGTAAFESAATCGLATGTNYWTKSTRELDGAGGQLILTDTTDETRFIGWTSYPATGATHALRYQFGDAFTAWMASTGGALQGYSYHGMAIDLGEAGAIPSQSTTENFAVTLHNTGSSITLAAGTASGNITLTPGSTGIVSSSRPIQGSQLQIATNAIAPVVTATGSGTTSTQQGIETGGSTMSLGGVTVTFSTAFTTNAPICTCTDTSAVQAVKCTPSTTTMTITGNGSDVVDWICVGQK